MLQFKFIASVYELIKNHIGLEGPLPCYLAEDETCVKRMVRWLPKSDTLLGFCGKKEGHKCIAGLEIKVGEGQSGYKAIEDAFQENVVGHQARCIIVNPLHPEFPRLCLVATSTCNQFDAKWVQDQWEEIGAMWKQIYLHSVGPILGHASDGDSRRRKLMLEDYTGRGSQGRLLSPLWEGWPLTHSMETVEDMEFASGLHDQDYIHNTKKLVNPLDSVAKTLKMGSKMVNISHLVMVSEQFQSHEHGMTLEDIKRIDRQNWASAQRLCSRKVIRCLCRLRTENNHVKEMCAGTETYLTICADYIDIFLNTALTLRERVVCVERCPSSLDFGDYGCSMATKK